jgi:TIR domain/NB-ARC domain
MDVYHESPPITIFYSYAHEDELLRNELSKHLSALKRQGIISEWYDRQIVAGTNWTLTIDEHINTASVILLLISPDFLASDYCYGVEMQRALERQEQGDARVIPVLLRPVDWQGMPFADLQCLPRNSKPVTTWRNRDEAFSSIARGIRTAIEDLNIPLNHAVSSLPHIWNVPYPRNLFFTGHEDLLMNLATLLRVDQTAALTQSLAISGLGGVGKTQIALEYAYRYRNNYDAVFWTQGETRETLTSSFLTIAELLKLPEKDAKDQNIPVDAVIKWLETHTRWLLILDNSDDLGITREFIPPIFGGHILLTTRAQAMGRLAQSLKVETMNPDVGALFLLRRAAFIAFNASLEEADDADREVAMEIVKELGGLPLALDQAGAYIEETANDLSEYLELYRTQRSALLKRRGGLISDHPEPVATTWAISFQKVEQLNPVANEILRLCAFLYPDAIPEEIIIKGLSFVSKQAQPFITDPFTLTTALESLLAYSLVTRDKTNHTLSIHRLIQAVLKDEMNTELYWQWAKRAISIVNEVFPRFDITTVQQCERFLSQALACVNLIEQGNLAFLEAAQLLHNTYGGPKSLDSFWSKIR